MDDKFKLVKFVDGDFELEVKTDLKNETVWLTQKQMAELFNVSVDNISLHTRNILKEGELNYSVVEESSVTANDGKKYKTKFYNLDMIISIGFRIKSSRGIIFRKWANKILKDYLIMGYAVNEHRIEILNKTIEIQNKMLSSALNIDQESLVNVIEEYTNALDLLDDYDHQCVKKPAGRTPLFHLHYNECRNIIDFMKFGNSSNVFGVEKENGKLNGILCAINQTAFGEEVYPY